MRYGARIALVAALLSITSCSSGPRAPHDPAEQARQVRLFADQLEQHCLDRNLTLDPYPKTSNNYRETDHARSNSCTLWRRARGGSDLDHRFFVYQNQQGLVQELKQRFGVLYHRHIGMIGVCEAGREHFMLLRDGSTVLYIAFSNHAFNGAYCSPSTYGGRWQQVVVRLSKACSFSYQNDTSHYLACGDYERISNYSRRTAWYGTVAASWPEDIWIDRLSVLNLQRLSDQELQRQQQAQQVNDVDEAWLHRLSLHIDGIDYYIQQINEGNQHARAHNQTMLQYARAEREARYQAISSGFMQGLQSGQANIADAIAQHQTFSADLSRQWQQMQQQQTLEVLRQRPQFDERQLLPSHNAKHQPRSGQSTSTHASAEASSSPPSRPTHQAAPSSEAPTPGSGLSPAPAQPNQCWQQAEPPLSSCIETNARERDGAFHITMTNRCTRRIYVRSCGSRLNAPEFCAVSGLLPGNNWTHTVYKSWQPTGQYRTQWVGSTHPAEDWICAREAGWHQ